MRAIEDYQFGSMTIGGHRYTADLIVLPSGEVLPEWWRAEGHRLVLEDLTAIVGHGARPETLVIGTGAAGQMSVPEETRVGLSAYGITPLVVPTPEAVEVFNRLAADQPGRVAGAFHLTC